MSLEAKGIRNGDWYAKCDRCAGRFFGSTMKVQWDNLFVCTSCYEERHPLDMPQKLPEENMTPPNVRSQSYDDTSAEFTSVEAAQSENWYGN